MRFNSLQTLAVAAAMTAVSAFAATPAIGVVSSIGNFSVNNIEVVNNASVLDGSQVKMIKTPGAVQLRNGSSILLGQDSVGTVYGDRFLLNTGVARVDHLGKYEVQSAGYRVVADTPNTQGSFKFANGTFEVASLNGSLRVFDPNGALLTRVASGTSASFKAHDNGPQDANDQNNQNNQKRRSGAGYVTGNTGKVLAVAGGAATVAGVASAAYVGDHETGSSTTLPLSQ
jgi:hypothetical protein